MNSAARFLALLACVGSLASTSVSAGSAKPLTILDGDGPTGSGPLDIESIAADYVCSEQTSNTVQLRKFATIGQLADYFERTKERRIGSTGGASLNRCIDQHLDCVQLLNGVVSESNDNVCSDAKVSLIEDFHQRCIVSPAGFYRAPHILRLFFQHYAVEVGEVCRQSLALSAHSASDKLVEGDSLLDELLDKFGQFHEVKDYDNVILTWNVVRELGPPKLANQCTGGAEQVRMLVKMREAQQMRRLQRKCLRSYRPVYAQLILPSVRLSILGYSSVSERLEQTQPMREWFSVTQLCESILPIKFYTDPQMKASKIVTIDRREADRLALAYDQTTEEETAAETEVQPAVEPAGANRLRADGLWSVLGFSDSQELVSAVGANQKARRATLRKLLRKLVKKLPRLLVNKQLFASVKKDNGSTEEESLAEVLSKPVEALDDSDLDKLTGSLELVSNEPLEERYELPRPSKSGALSSLASESDPSELLEVSGAAPKAPPASSGPSCFGFISRPFRWAKNGIKRIRDNLTGENEVVFFVLMAFVMLIIIGLLTAVVGTSLVLFG